jgi:hypothetical protein
MGQSKKKKPLHFTAAFATRITAVKLMDDGEALMI